MPGNFTPPSLKGQQEAEETAPAEEAIVAPVQDNAPHGVFSAKTSAPTAPEEPAKPETAPIPKKISSEDYKTPAFKTIASRVALMPDLISTYRKNLDDSRSAVELGFYRGSLNGQIDILDGAQRTFRQVGSNGEDEALAKNLMDTVNAFRKDFEELEKKTAQLISDVKTKRVVGPEICVPLKKDDGNPNPEATALIRENLSGQEIINAVAETREESGGAQTTSNPSPLEEKPSSSISYAPPSKETVVAPNATQEKIAQAEVVPAQEAGAEKEIKENTPEKEDVSETPTQSPQKEAIPPLQQEPMLEKEIKVSSPLLETETSQEDASVPVSRLWNIIKGGRLAEHAFVLSLAVSPIPSATPLQEQSLAAKKQTRQETVPKAPTMKPLSLEDENRLNLFVQ